ncbi:hypothetical protein H5410_026225 [Solanum commersonii]|uniref:Uncharacterized protein n=1 Tax=Solanum commersonii TaxID=4109 RepID=A0A9J5YY19_SOLCO|nr:hypothetical protein H5410_026225 [Solanum commersonii]
MVNNIGLTEYLECKFNDATHNVEVKVKIDAQVLSKREIFRYLRSIIQKDEDIDDHVPHRIEAGLMMEAHI